jgi:hypothetical protein
MRFVGMMMPQPPAPDANTLQWLALESGRRQLAMSIVEQICAPDRSSPSIVDEHAMWCRSLAMALRPGLWLQNLEPDRQVGVCLLAHWIGPDCWSRLRLAWPMPLAEVPEQDITVNAGAPRKLQALWPAVLWRVTVSTQDTPEVSNVG